MTSLPGTGKRANWYLCVQFRFHSITLPHPRGFQKYEGIHDRELIILVENWQLLLTRCAFDTAGSASPRTTLEMYNPTLSDDAWADRCVFALPEGGRLYLPEIFPNSFCPCPSPTFYKRPEDRVLLIFHESDPIGVTAIVVSVSTLMHFFKPRRFVAWDEWEKYTWAANPQESPALLSPPRFVSSSGFLRHRPHPYDDQLLRVTVTTFIPSIEEKPSPAIGSARDGQGEHMPFLVDARTREFDIYVGTDPEGWHNTKVMMTEDNIVIITVRRSPEHGVQILTKTIAQFRTFKTPGNNPDVLNREAARDLTELGVGVRMTHVDPGNHVGPSPVVLRQTRPVG